MLISIKYNQHFEYIKSRSQPTLFTVQTQTDFSHRYRVKACIICGLPTMPDPKPSPSPSHNAPTPP